MKNNYKKNIIISAINITNAGPFAILKECLSYLSENLSDLYNIIALVHDKSSLKIDNITYYDFPDSKKSWFKRLYYEYLYFKKLSEKLRPYLWLSLHDITPNVKTEIMAVYCHHASPFYKLSFKDLIMDPKFALFHFFYRYLYMINIRKNNFVIVQQNCTRERFKKVFGLDNVIVSRPHVNYNADITVKKAKKDKRYKFFYPSFPRVFKNFEVICEATRILANKKTNGFEIYLTIDGRENSYSKYIYNRYKNLKEIKFIGVQTRDEVFEYYDMADCMVFPSKLESWGMPITEFKNFARPILLADLEYAHETIGSYDKVKFFNPDNPTQLSHLMNEIMEDRLIFEKAEKKDIEHPFASDWERLFDILLTKRAP